MNSIVLCGIDSKAVRRIRSAVNSVSVTSWNQFDKGDFISSILNLNPTVVALGPDLGDVDRFKFTRNLLAVDPTLGVLIVDKQTEATMRRTLESGAKGVMPPDAKASLIRSTFTRILEGTRLLREKSAAAAAPTSRTITVASAKGGAGKTVIATNLAAALATDHPRQVAVVDLDLQFGDIATALLLSPEHSILDATKSLNPENGTTALKVFLTRHAPTDLFALCAPDDPAVGEGLRQSDIGDVLDSLATEMEYLVIDLPGGLGETSLTAIERATDIALIVDLDVPSVRGAQKLLEALDTVGLTGADRHLILNRADSKVGLGVDEVESALGRSVDVALPSLRDVPLSLNEGRPLVSSKPRTVFSRRIVEFARTLGVPSRTIGAQR
jgi:pilus assembly protein CpaE